jgi:hypothetical protein
MLDLLNLSKFLHNEGLDYKYLSVSSLIKKIGRIIKKLKLIYDEITNQVIR